MERAMGSEITVWWGPDDMVSALGFGTEENMTAVRAMKSSLASWHDSTPVCLIDRKRLGALAAERPWKRRDTGLYERKLKISARQTCGPAWRLTVRYEMYP